jgi:glycine cleavage system aminomethyltransferase T
MVQQTLEDTLQAADDPVDMLRNQNRGSVRYPNVPSQHTNWIEEQRAWRETCSLADQSHHMVDLWVKGPDALQVFSDLGVNRFDDFAIGQAKQLVVCNPDGYVIGDGILFRLADDSFHLVGVAPAPNWVQYNIETGDYNATIERDDDSVLRDGPPKNFRFQIQGPNALMVMQSVTDGPFPEIPFFNFKQLSINGRDIYALGHGMSGEAGFEFWGPFEYSDEIRNVVLEAGEDYGIRQLGWKSYASGVASMGWIANPVPAVYGEEMQEYQQWLDADSYEAKFAVGGSLTSDEVHDYYLKPFEIGYGRFVSFDHDFVGRAALEEAVDKPTRTKVTLVWNSDDVTDVFESLLQKGDTYKYIDLPIFLWASHFDTVFKNGDPIGVSKYPTYDYNERTMLSLGVVDKEHSKPGTELTFVWGEEGESMNPAVEPHAQTDIRATVAPVPYVTDRRKNS